MYFFILKYINNHHPFENEKITTDKEEFKQLYMNKDNVLSDSGIRNLSNKLTGYISYTDCYTMEKFI